MGFQKCIKYYTLYYLIIRTTPEGEGVNDATPTPPKRQGLSRLRGPWVGLTAGAPHGLYTAGKGNGCGIFGRAGFALNVPTFER